MSFGGRFGHMLGLGVAASVIITVIAIGRTLAGPLEGGMRTVIVFAAVAICTILGGAVLATFGLLVYRGQLARLHLAERRLEVEAQARQLGAMHAEVLEADEHEALEGGGPRLEQFSRPAILGKQPRHVLSRRLEAVPDPDGPGEAS